MDSGYWVILSSITAGSAPALKRCVLTRLLCGHCRCFWLLVGLLARDTTSFEVVGGIIVAGMKADAL